jgi:predicted ATPase/DNA-binding SARP family transcriptional activator
MNVGLLGPLEVQGVPARALGSPKVRGLLCLLALRVGRGVATEAIEAALWGEEPPASARKAVQGYVSVLRRVLGEQTIATTPGGYELRLPSSDVDLCRFEDGAAEGRRLIGVDPRRAARVLSEALGLWRGPPLPDLANQHRGAAEIVRLTELRGAVEDDRTEALLASGEHASLVPALSNAVAAEPLHERRWAQLMVALYRSGRQGDALRAFQRLRAHLVSELGIEPGADLCTLEQAILVNAPELQWSPAPAPDAEPAGRRDAPSGTVTLLVTEIEGAAALWEADAVAMARALERHDEVLLAGVLAVGGHVVDHRAGSASVAFSSARQALACALDVQRALAALTWPTARPLRARMALHAGEVADPAAGYVGEPLSRAEGLRAAAHGGQVLVSSAVERLVVGDLSDDVALRDLGEHRLGELARPEHVFQLVAPGLADERAPLRSLGSRPLHHNLPHQLTSFVGRQHELAMLRSLQTRSRLVTLTGAGGAGKSRLALELAGQSLDEYPEGVWLVELASVSEPDQVVTAVATTLGVRETPPRPLLESVASALAQRRLFVVLDNCEHVLVSAAQMAEVLLQAVPGLVVVATSREPLGLAGEQVYRVPSLSLPDHGAPTPEAAARSEAVQLFVDRAARHDAGFVLGGANTAAVISICRRLDGIPLALELAAARLRSLSVAEVEGRLDNRFQLLTGGSRTAMPRQQTLRALIDWSYGLLTADERELLDRLSVFAGGFTLDAAEAVCTRPAATRAVVDLLASLVDKSLVQADAVETGLRYRLLETVRQYAIEQLVHRGTGEVKTTRRAHAEYYLALAEESAPHLHRPEQVQWLDGLEEEHDNIRGALANLEADTEAAELLLRFAVALRHFWVIRGHRAEAEETLDAALAHPGAAEPSLLRARALSASGSHHANRGNHALAQVQLTEGLAIARAQNEEVATATLLGERCYLSWLLGEHDQARRFADEAVEVAAASGDPSAMGAAYESRAMALAADGRADARADVLAALRCFETADFPQARGRALGHLALIEIQAGNLAAATANLDAALALVTEAGDDGTLHIMIHNRALAALLTGDAAGARDLFADALVRSDRVGDRSGTAYAVLGLALCLSAAGDAERATVLHGHVETMLVQLGETLSEPEHSLRQEDLAALGQALGAGFEVALESGRRASLGEVLGRAGIAPSSALAEARTT